MTQAARKNYFSVFLFLKLLYQCWKKMVASVFIKLMGFCLLGFNMQPWFYKSCINVSYTYIFLLSSCPSIYNNWNWSFGTFFFFLFFSHSHLSSGLYLWSIIYFYLIEENTMERVFSINSYYASYLFSELFMSILLSVWEKWLNISASVCNKDKMRDCLLL